MEVVLGLYGCYIGIMANKMGTTILGLGFQRYGPFLGSLQV